MYVLGGGCVNFAFGVSVFVSVCMFLYLEFLNLKEFWLFKFILAIC